MSDNLIRELADRAELADLVARHSLWIDEARYDESARLFTEDVTAKTRGGELAGRDALTDLARSRHGEYRRTLHSKGNLVIELAGDTATVRASDIAVYVLDDKTEAVAAAIHRYGARRTADGWRFDHLEVEPVALTTALDRAL
ncbi:nuclear transport factor 2 family protein [Glycomyces rhizosphaerae]|uniref:Nuclear transport factor 2 family protein n=1 Tax=Glycomyces rhizosphaerae TaxID=2054422 RepID=A0ABV7Q515_9ACTN